MSKKQKNCVYINTLDEELDFIGKFESLQKDIEFIKKKLNIKKKFPFHKKLAKSEKRSKYQDYYNEKTKKVVQDLFKKDIEKFKYTFK